MSLGLRWRPREENTEADQLTNEVYDGFEQAQRLHVSWGDLDFGVLDALIRTREEFVRLREVAKESSKLAPKVKGKKFDKSPW